MVFDIAIMNPPFSAKSSTLHHTMIKRTKKICKRLVVIIPSKEGNILLSEFKFTKEHKMMQIFAINSNESIKWEIWTKFPQTEYFVNVPRLSFLMKKFFETGEYKAIDKEGNFEYLTFSFNNEEDLNLFKERLNKKDWLLRKGMVMPNYEDILKDINYVKKYKEI